MGKSKDILELLRMDWRLHRSLITPALSALTMGVTCRKSCGLRLGSQPAPGLEILEAGGDLEELEELEELQAELPFSPISQDLVAPLIWEKYREGILGNVVPT